LKYIKYVKLHPYKKHPEFITKPARAREGFLMEIGIHVLHVLHVPQAEADAPESDQSRAEKYILPAQLPSASPITLDNDYA
jgi:hypothetical protein